MHHSQLPSVGRSRPIDRHEQVLSRKAPRAVLQPVSSARFNVGGAMNRPVGGKRPASGRPSSSRAKRGTLAPLLRSQSAPNLNELGQVGPVRPQTASGKTVRDQDGLAIGGGNGTVHTLTGRILRLPPTSVVTGFHVTTVLGFVKTCKALNRPPGHVASALVQLLGCQKACMTDDHVSLKLQGEYSDTVVSNEIRRYVADYVVCKSCGRVDTELSGPTPGFLFDAEQRYPTYFVDTNTKLYTRAYGGPVPAHTPLCSCRADLAAELFATIEAITTFGLSPDPSVLQVAATGEFSSSYMAMIAGVGIAIRLPPELRLQVCCMAAGVRSGAVSGAVLNEWRNRLSPVMTASEAAAHTRAAIASTSATAVERLFGSLSGLRPKTFRGRSATAALVTLCALLTDATVAQVPELGEALLGDGSSHTAESVNVLGGNGSGNGGVESGQGILGGLVVAGSAGGFTTVDPSVEGVSGNRKGFKGKGRKRGVRSGRRLAVAGSRTLARSASLPALSSAGGGALPPCPPSRSGCDERGCGESGCGPGAERQLSEEEMRQARYVAALHRGHGAGAGADVAPATECVSAVGGENVDPTPAVPFGDQSYGLGGAALNPARGARPQSAAVARTETAPTTTSADAVVVPFTATARSAVAYQLSAALRRSPALDSPAFKATVTAIVASALDGERKEANSDSRPLVKWHCRLESSRAALAVARSQPRECREVALMLSAPQRKPVPVAPARVRGSGAWSRAPRFPVKQAASSPEKPAVRRRFNRLKPSTSPSAKVPTPSKYDKTRRTF